MNIQITRQTEFHSFINIYDQYSVSYIFIILSFISLILLITGNY